jgi:hypothetical protein
MAATIETSILESAARVLSSTCGALQTVILVPTKKGTQLQATSNGNVAAFSLPYTIEGLDKPMEFQADLFQNVMKGRASVTLTMNGSSLVATSGKYEAIVHGSDHDALGFTELVEAQDITLTPELQQYLSKSLPKLKIERAHSALPEVMLYAKITTKAAFMATYDSFQLCFTNGKSKFEEDIEFHVPYAKLTQLVKDLPMITKISVTAESMVVVSKQFKAQLALPAIDAESSISPEDIYTRCKETAKSSGATLSLGKEDLQAFIANSTSLVHTGSEIVFSATKGGTKLLLETPKGSTKAVVKSEGKTKPFGLDIRFVSSLVEKSGEQVSFDVVEDGGYVLCKSEGLSYVAVLSTTEAGDQDK